MLNIKFYDCEISATDEPRNFNKKLSGKLVIFNWQHPDYIETDLTIFIILVTEITPGLEPINQNKTIVYEEKLNFTTEVISTIF